MTAAIDPNRLREIIMFKDLPDDALSELAAHCRVMELPADETLFKQGDPGDSFYLLEDGQVHIMRQYPNGEEIVLATYGPYYIIGELSMLVGQPRTGSVVAVSDCDLLALDRDDLMKICDQYPVVAKNMLLNLGLRLYHMNLAVREQAIGNVQARIASMILLLAGYQVGVVPNLVRVTRMARSAAVDADMLDRMLQKWVNMGYIAYDGQTLEVKNLEALRDLAG